jgi:hypothetical protein
MNGQTHEQSNETSYYDGTRSHLLIGSGGEEDDYTYARVMTAQPYQWPEHEVWRDLEQFAPRPFQILR